jgi:superfamily II DNA/RNA helicase
MKSFRQLGVADAVVEALSAPRRRVALRHPDTRHPDGLNGQDLLAKSPTGSGKTLAFAIPIVQRLNAAEAKPSR